MTVIEKPVKAGTSKKVVQKPKKSLAKNLGAAANNQFKAGSKAKTYAEGKIQLEKDWVKNSVKKLDGSTTTKGLVPYSKKELAKMSPAQRKAVKAGQDAFARQTGM